MRYPLNEIQKLYTAVRDVSITTFANSLTHSFPDLIPDHHCHIDSIGEIDKPVACHDIPINNTILQIVVSNLAVLSLTEAEVGYEEISHVPLKWANDHGSKEDKQYIRHLAYWAALSVKNANYIVDLTHLAYYEADMHRSQRLGSENIILPARKDCALIAQMANIFSKAIGLNFDNFYQLAGSIDYTQNVTKGNIDLVINETLYLTTTGPLEKRDRYALLVAYTLAMQSKTCQSIPVRHVCMVSLSHGTTLRIDTQQLDPMVLGIVKDCLYGPTLQGVVETTLSRKRRISLLMGLTALLETKTHDAVVREVQRIGTAYTAQTTENKESYRGVINYFTHLPVVRDEATIVMAVQCLNQWLYDLECGDEADLKTVRLDDTLAKDIVNKAINF